MWILKPREPGGNCHERVQVIDLVKSHWLSLKGLNRQYIYDTPLPPRGQEKTPLISKEEIVRGRSLLPGMIRSAMGAIIDILTYRQNILNRSWGAGR